MCGLWARDFALSKRNFREPNGRDFWIDYKSIFNPGTAENGVRRPQSEGTVHTHTHDTRRLGHTTQHGSRCISSGFAFRDTCVVSPEIVGVLRYTCSSFNLRPWMPLRNIDCLRPACNSSTLRSRCGPSPDPAASRWTPHPLTPFNSRTWCSY